MSFTRREVLAAFLGLPLALAACRDKDASERPLPPGEIVGQSVALGHVLREGRSFEVPPDRWQNVKAAIIGGGAAGLAAAWKFRREGFDDFVLLELESAVGGTARSGRDGAIGYPWGAHYLPVPFQENVELIALLDEMELTDGRRTDGEVVIKEQFLCREPEERVFYKGRWYEGLYLNAGASDEDKRQLQAFQREIDRYVNWRDASGRRAFVVPVEHCSPDAEITALDNLTFAEWLRQKGFTSDRLFWYCDYACRDDYGLKLDQTSAWAGLFYFCSRVRSVGDDSQPFITFPEGNGRFIDHMLGSVSENVRKSHTVVAVEPNGAGVDVICLSGNEVSGFRCERAIFASPVFTAPYVIRGFRDRPPFAAGEFQHNSWFVANLHLKDRPRPRFARDFPLAWDNVLYESPSLGYVTATHQKGIDHGPTILTYYYPMCAETNARTKLFDYSRDQLADVCLSDLVRAHSDIYVLTERLDVMRWGHAMISPRPQFIWSGERQKASLPYRGIHFAHSDLSGIALFEHAFFHGIRAAGEILDTVRS